MIIRAPRVETNFYHLDKRISEDTRLSWCARGLLIFLLGKLDNWRISVTHLQKQTIESAKPTGRDGIYHLLNELITVGYVQRIQSSSADGKFKKVDYLVSEIPLTDSQEAEPLTDSQEAEPLTDFQEADKKPLTPLPYTAEPYPANPTLIKNDINQVMNQTTTTPTPPQPEPRKAEQQEPKAVVVVEDFVKQEKTNSENMTALWWVTYFVNVLGYKQHEAQTPKTMPMFHDWVRQGVEILDLQTAMIKAHHCCGDVTRLDNPAGYKKFVATVMANKKNYESCVVKPDKLKKADANKPIVPLWTGHKPAPKVNNDDHFTFLERQYGKTGVMQ